MADWWNENPDRLPGIISAWQMQRIAPNVKDCIECPDQCGEAIPADYNVATPVNAINVRWYVAEPSFDPRYQSISYCDAYDTRRTAITEALRKAFQQFGAKEVSFNYWDYGILTGYGLVERNKNVIQALLLIDDQPAAYSHARNDPSEYYVMLYVPLVDVIWRDNPVRPAIEPEIVAMEEFSQLWQEYMA